MTKHEKIAAANIKGCFNYEIGGLYNAYLDGEEDFPTIEEMKDSIYILSMNDRYVGGAVILTVPREMRFAGKEFSMEYIDKPFENDSDVAEIPWKEK